MNIVLSIKEEMWHLVINEHKNDLCTLPWTKGSSLTAVDAIRTLSRHNGFFEKDDKGQLHYRLKAKVEVK
jgi:hypothetical protein